MVGIIIMPNYDITSKLNHTHRYAIENTKKLHSQNKQPFHKSTVYFATNR